MNFKRKIAFFSFSLIGALWFAIAFQSLHSFEHLVDLIQKEHCHHKYDHAHTVISHGHKDFDDCFVCHYNFSTYLPIEITFFESIKISNFTSVKFVYCQFLSSYTGSRQKSRAPPYFIV
ncbi:hypothetical protein [Flavobacterium sp.]|uniref:hypothetical protein n=1 Tax=Flavobacterium sp. TaxID=239 RepID=UPI003D119A3C